jgi:mono/diheme cytochrome c family protein
MKLRFLSLLPLFVLPAMAAPLKIELPTEAVHLKTAPGGELVAAHCLTCHSAEYLTTQPRLPRAYWQGAVAKMQGKFGAPIEAKDVDAVVDYLVRNYGAEAAPKP